MHESASCFFRQCYMDFLTMKIETFKKRFGDLPIKGLSMAILKGKNGKYYSISLNRKGEPVAKIVELTANSI